ncbi:MAG: tetratricopeptide repeat protein [Azospirillaceae bacterium]|nr:tetratricopeptide repeat protein [Azospirillaceae bacterium]
MPWLSRYAAAGFRERWLFCRQQTRHSCPSGHGADSVISFKGVDAIAMSTIPEEFSAGLAHHQAGRLDQAEAAYQSILAAKPKEGPVLYLLGVIQLQRGDRAAAVPLLHAAARYAPDTAQIHVTLGQALAALGRLPEAFAAYGRAVALGAGDVGLLNDVGVVLHGLGRYDAAATVAQIALGFVPDQAGMYINLASAQAKSGKPALAATSFRRAAVIDPNAVIACHNLGLLNAAAGAHHAAAQAFTRTIVLDPAQSDGWNNLGNSRQALGLIDQAPVCYRRALAIAPTLAGAAGNLGNALWRAGRPGAAAACYRAGLQVDPADPSFLFHLAQVLYEQGAVDSAITAYRRAIQQRPDYAEALYALSAALNESDRSAEALPLLRRAEAVRPIVAGTRPRDRDAVRVLIVMAPARCNIPLNLVVDGVTHQRFFTWVFPGMDPNRTVPDDFDVVFNIIADADAGIGYLERAGRLLTGCTRPILNPPQRIAATARHRVGSFARGLDRIITPPFWRFGREIIPDFETLSASCGGAPLLLRPVGGHGGEDMALIADASAWRRYFESSTRQTFYAGAFVETQSLADRLFRKYRVIFIGGKPYPYHLAISSQWKVHYVTADQMGEAWAQQEEARFLEQPESVFGAAWPQLQRFAEAVGLDYFGIDCALDAGGRVVLFEANATMLVHVLRNAPPAQRQAALRIKEALDLLIGAAARR